MNQKKTVPVVVPIYKVAVVVPIYKNSFTEYEEYSFYKNIKILEERDIFLICPKHLEDYAISLSKKIKNGYVTVVDDIYFGDARAHNRLLLSETFYNNYINYKFVLICHFDVIVFKDDLDYWMSLNFDFIGAPLFYGHNQNSLKFLRKGGNGGFCLRNVQSHLKVINKTKYFYSMIKHIFKNDKNLNRGLRKVFNYYYNYKLSYRGLLHEDTYWSEFIPEAFPWYKVAEIEHSMYFGFEMNSRLLYKLNNGTLPMGIHAWWSYDKEFCLELIRKQDPNFDKMKNKLLKDTTS